MNAEPGIAPMISVVIPTFNEGAYLPATLTRVSTLEGNWEVIVVDSESTDETVAIADGCGVKIIQHAPAGRGAAMNAGAGEATGDLLLFLHADTLLPSNAYQLIIQAMADDAVSATGFRLRMDRQSIRFRLLSPVATLRFRIQRTFFGDQAIAVRKSEFDALGGYQEPLLMEDVELSLRLRQSGKLVLLPSFVTTSARRFEDAGVLRTLLSMTLFQVAYSIGVPANIIRRWYLPAASHTESTRKQIQRASLERLKLVDIDGQDFDLMAVTSKGPVLLVFLRWLG